MIELGRRQKASLQPMTCHCFLARSNLSRSLMISFTRMFSPQPTCLNPVHIFCKQLPLGPLTVRSACRRCLCRCWNFASHSAPCVLEQGLEGGKMSVECEISSSQQQLILIHHLHGVKHVMWKPCSHPVSEGQLLSHFTHGPRKNHTRSWVTSC